MTQEFNGAERQQYRAREPDAPAASLHTPEMRLEWKELLFRTGWIVVLALFALLFADYARNDPDLVRPDIGAWEAGIKRAAWWCGTAVFSGTAAFLATQLLATALSGRSALGFIPWIRGPQT